MRPDLWAEFNAARGAMSPADRGLLAEHAIAPGDVVLLCGVARVRLIAGGERYEPHDAGDRTFISPVMIEWPDTPESSVPAQAVRFGELIDLVTWHPAHPHALALRVGDAEWLGSIPPQYLDPPPVVIHQGVPSWLRSRASGLVLLTREPASRWRTLSACNRITAQDELHAKELRRALRLPGPIPPVAVA